MRIRKLCSLLEELLLSCEGEASGALSWQHLRSLADLRVRCSGLGLEKLVLEELLLLLLRVEEEGLLPSGATIGRVKAPGTLSIVLIHS